MTALELAAIYPPHSYVPEDASLVRRLIPAAAAWLTKFCILYKKGAYKYTEQWERIHAEIQNEIIVGSS